jgi:hypothetical protein
MLSRYFIPALLVLALFIPSPAQAETTAPSPRFTATYYYTNVRCPSCLTIERLTEKTIKSEFVQQLGSGLLEWRTVNIDGEGNFHFVKDYNLYTKSVIISEMSEGKELRWKNLQKVWELLGNEDKFREYLKDEISAFMAGP